MLKDNIPVIGIEDEIVDEERKPSALMVMYFHTLLVFLKTVIADDAPQDGKLYGRKDGQWIEIV